MSSETQESTYWAPSLISSVVIILVALISSALVAIVVAQDTNVGWTIWYYPLVAVIPVVSCLALSGGVNLVFNAFYGRLVRDRLGGVFGFLVRFIAVAYVIWAIAANWIFSNSVVALPEVNPEAESLFFYSWQEIAHRNLIGSALVVVALAAVLMRSAIRYWVPIAIISAVFGIWELGSLFGTLIAALA